MGQYKKVTTVDIAKLAGCSQSTVSMILSHNPQANFSEKMVKQVLDAAEQLGYNKYNRKKTFEITNNILAVVPNFTNPYYTMLLESIQNSCHKSGYGVLCYCTMRNRIEEERLFQMIDSMHVAGVVYTYCSSNTDIVQRISEKTPLIVIGDKDENIDADLVELNSIKCGKIMAEHLLELGHRKIAYISTPVDDKQLARSRRLQGIEMQFERHGIKDGVIVKTKSLAQLGEMPNMFTEYSTGYDLTRELVQDDQGVTAIVGLNDMVALGVMDALYDEKLRVPQDYSVMGCDNTIIGRMRKISLTSVEHYISAKGRQAVEIMLTKLQGTDSGNGELPKIVRVEYEPRVVVRESTAFCRKTAECKDKQWNNQK